MRGEDEEQPARRRAVFCECQYKLVVRQLAVRRTYREG